MDVYILDELLRRIAIVDEYESLVWTERYSSYGDFVLVIRADRGTKALFPVGTRLAINVSYRVMVIETVESTTTDSGVSALKITGRSLECILEDRVARNTLDGLNTTPSWEITGTPADIARYIFNQICVTNVITPEDIIPFYTSGSMFPPGTIAEPEDIVTITFEPESLYNVIKKICDMYHLGFRLLRNGDTSELYFDIYTGDDRTTLQTELNAVIFSSELDNLSNTSELTSVAKLKNVAYVYAPNGSKIVYADNVDASVSGFERRVLTVKATDIDLPAGAELDDALTQRGKEALAEYRAIIAFDGEIPQNSQYVYGVHYELGDLIEQRNADGLATNMRVTEQIFISDAEGVRAYPTLSIDLLITPGSWYAWDASQVWDDAEEYWADA